MNKKIKILLIVLLVAGISAISIVLLLNFKSKTSSSNIDISQVVLETENSRYKINDDIYAYTGKDCRYTLVKSKDEASLIDTGYEQNDFNKIKKYLDDNKIKLKNVFITHMHDDHCGNMEMYKKIKVNIILPVDLTDNQIVKMGDKTFKAIKLPGHNMDQDVGIELVDEHILVAGDAVVTNKIPLICNEGTVGKFIKTLNFIKEQKYNVIIPGHGKILESDVAVNRVLEYFTTAVEEVRSVLEYGGGLDECIRKIGVKECIKDTSFMTEEYIEVMAPYHQSNLSKIFNNLPEEK